MSRRFEFVISQLLFFVLQIKLIGFKLSYLHFFATLFHLLKQFYCH